MSGAGNSSVQERAVMWPEGEEEKPESDKDDMEMQYQQDKGSWERGKNYQIWRGKKKEI